MISAKTPWPYPTLFAHRGGGSLAPENTLVAMEVGVAHDYTAVEFDVKLSADGIPLLMHDDVLSRTTNGSGKVADYVMTALEVLDAGAWHSQAFVGERIPRFSVVMRYLHRHGVCANVEIKPCAGREAETGAAVVSWCAEFAQDSVLKPLLSSFNVEALNAARLVAPHMPLGLLVEIPQQAHLATLDMLGAVSLHCHHAMITRELVEFFHRYGYRVLTYTVNEPDRVAALLTMGVDGIFTDNLAVMAKRFPAQLHDGGRKALFSASAPSRQESISRGFSGVT